MIELVTEVVRGLGFGPAWTWLVVVGLLGVEVISLLLVLGGDAIAAMFSRRGHR